MVVLLYGSCIPNKSVCLVLYTLCISRSRFVLNKKVSSNLHVFFFLLFVCFGLDFRFFFFVFVVFVVVVFYLGSKLCVKFL